MGDAGPSNLCDGCGRVFVKVIVRAAFVGGKYRTPRGCQYRAHSFWLLPEKILASNEDFPFLVLYRKTLIDFLLSEHSLLLGDTVFLPIIQLYPRMLHERGERNYRNCSEQCGLQGSWERPPNTDVLFSCSYLPFVTLALELFVNTYDNFCLQFHSTIRMAILKRSMTMQCMKKKNRVKSI